MTQLPLDELQWKSPEWIQSFGLRTDNVLDYFSQSPFYDRTSNNQVAKMQQQFAQPRQPVRTPKPSDTGTTAIPGTDIDPHRQAILSTYLVHSMLDQELRKLKGIEYILAYVREPDFWVIRKQNRTGPTSVEPLQDYYIIGANVYQAPAAAKIVQSRLLATNFHLSRALASLRRMSQFQPSQGANFISTPTTPGTRPRGADAAPASAPASAAPTVVTSAGSAGTAGPGTANAQSILTGSTDPAANMPAHADVITRELMDKLLVTSMKSNPVYL